MTRTGECPICGGATESLPFVSGSPNAHWEVCTSCGHREPVFASDGEWVDWDCPVRIVDGARVYGMRHLRR